MATPAVRAIIHGNSTFGTTFVINNPSTTPGDTLIANIVCGSGSITITPQAGQGWVSIGKNGSGGAFISLFSRAVQAVAEPTSFTFTGSASDAYNGAITAVSNADPTTPVQTYSITAQATTTMTSAALTPARVGCLPLAFFGLQQPNSGTPGVLGLTAGWAETYAENYAVTVNDQYHSSEGQQGPITTDTVTAITATATWNSFGTPPGFATIILIQPGIPSLITINGSATPSPIQFTGPGQTQNLTIAQTGASGAITLSVSDTTKVSLSATTVYPPTATVVATALASTTANVTITATGS